MPTAAQHSWSATGRLDPLFYGSKARLLNVALAPNLTLARGTILGELVGTNEVQSVTITGTPTGGTFTLTFAGQTTAPIPFNATAVQVQAALEALSTIGFPNVKVTGGPGPGTAFAVTFQNALGGTDVAAMTASGAGLTGGTTPGVTIGTTTAGVAGTLGTYKAYDVDNTDGSQSPRLILAHGCTTDGSGNVTLVGEHGAVQKHAPAYLPGGAYWKASELVGLDQNALDVLGGSVIEGNLASGIVQI
jgi:hypothetical protein